MDCDLQSVMIWDFLNWAAYCRSWALTCSRTRACSQCRLAKPTGRFCCALEPSRINATWLRPVKWADTTRSAARTATRWSSIRGARFWSTAARGVRAWKWSRSIWTTWIKLECSCLSRRACGLICIYKCRLLRVKLKRFYHFCLFFIYLFFTDFRKDQSRILYFRSRN